MLQKKLQDELEEDIQDGKDFILTVMRRDTSNNHAFEMHFKYVLVNQL